MRYYLTPVRMAVIKKNSNNKRWRRCGGKGTLLLCWWKCKSIQPLWRTVWRFLKKLKIELPAAVVVAAAAAKTRHSGGEFQDYIEEAKT